MSLASQIDDVGSLVTEAVHADPVTLKDGAGLVLNPVGVMVYGYAEELPTDPHESARSSRAFLHVANDLFTHIIHIRRGELAGVVFKNVNTIVLQGKTYRATHWEDQPTRAEVQFFTKLS